MGKLIDLTGQQFGKLTPLYSVRKRSKRGISRVFWACRCECGQMTLVSATNLKSGSVKSCGCSKKEYISQTHQKKNTYIFEGEYVVGITSNGDRFTIDVEDYDLVSPYCWRQNSNGYFITQDRDGEQIRLHRLIMGITDPEELVDHINHDTSFNAKCNLRVVSKSENMQNSVRAENNASGVKGVSWTGRERRWRAYIKIDGRQIDLGYYKSFDDAVAARKAAEERYFGEYSYDNSIAAVPRIAV